MTRTRTLTTLVLISALIMTGLTVSAAPGAAATPSTFAQTNDSNVDTTDSEVCEGNPQMSRTSITSPQDTITTETPGVIEANFRVDPSVPEDCTVVVDVEYSFTQSGFQFGGGADWEQSATDILATRFDNLGSGEIRSVDAEVYTNGAEAGDELTVIADYEIWYEGNRENSVQQSGIRKTIQVEEPNDGGTGPGPTEPPQWLEFLQNNLALVGIVSVAVIAVTGLVKREPIVNIFSEK